MQFSLSSCILHVQSNCLCSLNPHNAVYNDWSHLTKVEWRPLHIHSYGSHSVFTALEMWQDSHTFCCKYYTSSLHILTCYYHPYQLVQFEHSFPSQTNTSVHGGNVEQWHVVLPNQSTPKPYGCVHLIQPLLCCYAQHQSSISERHITYYRQEEGVGLISQKIKQEYNRI
jgi:hypothetical protein